MKAYSYWTLDRRARLFVPRRPNHIFAGQCSNYAAIRANYAKS